MLLERQYSDPKQRYANMKKQQERTGTNDVDTLRDLKNEGRKAEAHNKSITESEKQRHIKRRVNEDRLLAKELGIPYEALIKGDRDV